MDVEYLPNILSSQGRRLRRRGPKRLKTGKGPVVDQSSSDSNKILNVSDIFLQQEPLKQGNGKFLLSGTTALLLNLPGLSLPIYQKTLHSGGICFGNVDILCLRKICSLH